MVEFGQHILSGLFVGAIYTLIALGIAIVYKSTKVFNFAHPTIVMFSAMISMVTISRFGTGLGLLLALVLTAGLGFILYQTALRPLIGQPLLAALLMTLALSVMMDGLALLIWGSWGYPYPPLFGKELLRVDGLVWSQPEFYGVVATLLVFTIIILFFRYTLSGKVMRATAEDHVLAQSMGIGVRRVFLVSWAMAGVVAAVAAVFLGTVCGCHTQLGIPGLKAIPAVLLGGLDSIGGSICGGLIVGLLETLTAAYVGTLVADVVPYIILLLILLIKPYGLFGLVRVERL